MICNLIRCVAFAQLLAFCSAKCDAAVIHTFNLTNLGTPGTGGFLGSTFNLNSPLLSDGGVFFTATLVVTGSGNIGFNSDAAGGVGVDGNTLNGGSGLESLRFSIQPSNPVGVNVAFNGFSLIGFSNFTNEDSGILSKDGSFSTGGDNTPVGTTSGTLALFPVPDNATAFSIFSNSGKHFSVASVTGSFTATATAVPEPATFGALTILGSVTTLLRSFRRRANSVDSESLVA